MRCTESSILLNELHFVAFFLQAQKRMQYKTVWQSWIFLSLNKICDQIKLSKVSTDPKKERENYCVFEKYHSLYKHCAITVICTVYVHYLTITRTQNFYNMPKGNDYAPYSFLPDCSIKVSNRLSKSTHKKIFSRWMTTLPRSPRNRNFAHVVHIIYFVKQLTLILSVQS